MYHDGMHCGPSLKPILRLIYKEFQDLILGCVFWGRFSADSVMGFTMKNHNLGEYFWNLVARKVISRISSGTL